MIVTLLGLSLSCTSCTDSFSGGGPSYEAGGGGTSVAWTGKICSLEEPFSVLGARPHGDLIFKFTPGGDSMKGTWTYHNDQGTGGVSEDGQGTYSVSLTQTDGSITLQGTTTLIVPGAGTILIPVNELMRLTPINNC